MSDQSLVPASDDPNAVIGLEDASNSDRSVPQIKVVHTEGVFEDSLSSEQYPELTCVILGLVKQRVLWEPNMGDEKELPLCRSYDHKFGHPAVDDDGNSRFPWAASGFTEQDGVLPCESCKLQEWGSHPSRDAPWCSETYCFVIAIPEGEGMFSPAILQFQRSGIKAARTYVSSYMNKRTPMFSNYTTIKLNTAKRGTTVYSTPQFTKGGDTDVEDHPEFGATYRGIRDYLQTPRVRVASTDDDDAETAVANPAASAPVSPPTATGSPLGGGSAPAPAAAPTAATGDDEELPF